MSNKEKKIKEMAMLSNMQKQFHTI